mmetsp:Transcript_3296/g.7124  ORF Transcript_3296/g.7124 Transcript_3296/m.7124 type:complete len:150 (+) Transcript_3296:235-684(+)
MGTHPGHHTHYALWSMLGGHHQIINSRNIHRAPPRSATHTWGQRACWGVHGAQIQAIYCELLQVMYHACPDDPMLSRVITSTPYPCIHTCTRTSADNVHGERMHAHMHMHMQSYAAQLLSHLMTSPSEAIGHGPAWGLGSYHDLATGKP